MIVRSQSPDVTVPPVSITEYVLRHAERLADKPALIDGPSGRVLTYGQLDEAVRRVATGLARRGLRKGDVVAIYSPNCPEYAVVFHAVASLGGVNTTVNPLYTAEELATQLKDAEARFLIAAPAVLEKARAAASRTGIGELFVFGAGEGEGARPFADLLASPASPPPVAIDPGRDVVALPYSSGTTGLPKGVMLTHRHLVANLRQCEGMRGFECFGERDVVMAALPFFHIYGLVVIMKLSLANGATLVTMPRFDLEQFLTLAQERRATRLWVVPPIVLALARHPMVDDYDLSSVRGVFSGAAPLGPELAAEAAARVGAAVVQGYGMTELSPLTHATPIDDPRPGTVGVLVPNCEARVVDPATGDDLGTGEDGELWIRGPNVMKGYLNNPDATAAMIDDDGWLHTGDIGHVDDDG
jgi:acyl-CoA synthetase (AMP-forming)/AMP-acid ligase II